MEFTCFTNTVVDDPDEIWVAACVDGNPEYKIGAWVDREGRVCLDDNVVWCVETDLENMGLDPESDEARELVREWTDAAREYGLQIMGEN